MRIRFVSLDSLKLAVTNSIIMIRYSSKTTLSSTRSWALFLVMYVLHSERIGGIPGQVHALKSYFSNVTLTANDGDLSVVVYLPPDVKPEDRPYYASSRFDWGSMIGSISRSARNPNTGKKETHVLYGTNQWRPPHDPWWTESGVGLASEFGVGDDGSFCNFMCGWDQVNGVTNGVLGYEDARSGETFLKIGVGALVKGSCSTCDSAEDYKFNSPYQFARPPVWTLETDQIDKSNTIVLSHQEIIDDRPYVQHGYKIERHITLNDDQLLVKTFLSNLGSKPISTVWYSHHFFTCDAHPVSNGYSVDFDLASSQGAYEEPGTWFWSTPLANYAKVYMHNNTDVWSFGGRGRWSRNRQEPATTLRVDMQRGIEADVKIKAEFTKAALSQGEFTLRGCNTKIRETIPEVGDRRSRLSMYAYNLYVESGTLSPEPQILLSVNPGETTSWTQQLDLADNFPVEPRSSSSHNPDAALGKLVRDAEAAAEESTTSNEGWQDRGGSAGILPAFALVVVMASFWFQSILTGATTRTIGRNRKEYFQVPDAVVEDPPNHRKDNTENHAI